MYGFKPILYSISPMLPATNLLQSPPVVFNWHRTCCNLLPCLQNNRVRLQSFVMQALCNIYRGEVWALKDFSRGTWIFCRLCGSTISPYNGLFCLKDRLNYIALLNSNSQSVVHRDRVFQDLPHWKPHKVYSGFWIWFRVCETFNESFEGCKCGLVCCQHILW